MKRRRFTEEQIIGVLKQAEAGAKTVDWAQGKTAVQVCKLTGVTEQIYYRWRKEYEGLRMDQAQRLTSLEKENARLKKLVADLSLNNQILKEVSSGNFQARRRGDGSWRRYESDSDLSESPSVRPAKYWDRHDRPNEESGRFPKKKHNWWHGCRHGRISRQRVRLCIEGPSNHRARRFGYGAQKTPA